MNNNYPYGYNGNNGNNGHQGGIGKSSIIDLDENVAAMLTAGIAVLLSFIGHLSYAAWTVPLVVLVLEKRSQFVRLCAAQSFAAGVVIVACAILRDVFGGMMHGLLVIPLGIIGLMLSLLQLAAAVMLVVIAINAYKMKTVEIPQVTDTIKGYIQYRG